MNHAHPERDVDGGVAAALASQARDLRLDRAAAELVDALRAAAISSMVLKGPATARVLYAGETRHYGDVDLLVSPRDFERATRVAESLGYIVDLPDGRYHRWVKRQVEGKDRALVRAGDGVLVELHRSFHLLPAKADLYGAIAPLADSIDLHGTKVPVAGRATVALLCLLHAKTAALPGAPNARLSADVARAVERIDEEAWRQAADIARSLGVEKACVASLRERGGSRGPRLASDLFPGVPPHRLLTAHLRTGSVMAFKIMNFRHRTWRSRLIWLATRPFPPLRPRYTADEQKVMDSWVGRRGWMLADLRSATRCIRRLDNTGE